MIMNPLLHLQQLGQSPWHDNIRRDQITSGQLECMVVERDITGLTSNPTIFEQAIIRTDDYNESLRKLAIAGNDAEQIFYSLVIDDIQAAADIFQPVYERTHGADGYVSIEVSPSYANDTESTIRDARQLWERVDRPNLMVKIPATKAGLEAITETVSSGINVNVTLIFSIERYGEVIDAFMAGLEQRLANGQSVEHVASVASFFVSRLDTLVDSLLEEKISAGLGGSNDLESLRGKAAVANARLAYRLFEQVSDSSRWAALSSQGARVQRPLWASTSTKNPSYSDVLYVESLIGPDTVNTMPPGTLRAFKDHGRVELTINSEVDQALELVNRLSEAQISMDIVTQKLEDEGVAAFFKSFDNLLAVIEGRRQSILG